MRGRGRGAVRGGGGGDREQSGECEHDPSQRASETSKYESVSPQKASERSECESNPPHKWIQWAYWATLPQGLGTASSHLHALLFLLQSFHHTDRERFRPHEAPQRRTQSPTPPPTTCSGLEPLSRPKTGHVVMQDMGRVVMQE